MTRDDWDAKGGLGMTRMTGMTRDDQGYLGLLRMTRDDQR